MTPKQRVQTWVDRFSAADVDGLAALYAEDATNHQVVIQRGYFDQLSFFRQQGIAVPDSCLGSP